MEQVFRHDKAVLNQYYFYLWPGISNNMTSHNLSGKMAVITGCYLGHGYSIKFWQSLTMTILQFHADQDISGINWQYYFDTANMHTTRTAMAKYSGNTGNLLGANTQIIAGCVCVGLSWHRRIGLDTIEGNNEVVRSIPSEMTPSPPYSSVLLEELKIFQDECMSSIRPSISETMAEFSMLYFPTPPRPRYSLPYVSEIEVHPSRLAAFRNFMGNPNTEWSCPEQAIFVEYLILGNWNILGILGTGFGKMTTIMFIAKEYSGGKSILVIMPLAALHKDFHERVRAHGLKASCWSANGDFDSTAHIIMAAVEDLTDDRLFE